jgi:hypothetical protein
MTCTICTKYGKRCETGNLKNKHLFLLGVIISDPLPFQIMRNQKVIFMLFALNRVEKKYMLSEGRRARNSVYGPVNQSFLK